MYLLYKLYYTNIIFIEKTIIDSLTEQQRNTLTPHAIDRGAMQASRRIHHQSSPYHLQLLSSVTARMSRLMVATQQMKENIIIYTYSK
jgi:hypothetical protein